MCPVPRRDRSARVPAKRGSVAKDDPGRPRVNRTCRADQPGHQYGPQEHRIGPVTEESPNSVAVPGSRRPLGRPVAVGTHREWMVGGPTSDADHPALLFARSGGRVSRAVEVGTRAVLRCQLPGTDRAAVGRADLAPGISLTEVPYLPVVFVIAPGPHPFPAPSPPLPSAGRCQPPGAGARSVPRTWHRCHFPWHGTGIGRRQESCGVNGRATWRSFGRAIWRTNSASAGPHVGSAVVSPATTSRWAIATPNNSTNLRQIIRPEAATYRDQ